MSEETKLEEKAAGVGQKKSRSKDVQKKAEESPKTAAKKEKVVYTFGKRKDAVARAAAYPGKGIVRINHKPLSLYQPEMARLMIEEPIRLAGPVSGSVDIFVNVSSGGVMGQADAARQAIAKALVSFDKSLKKVFLDYDRSLLVADVRRNEPHKPGSSKKGPRAHKQRSKR